MLCSRDLWLFWRKAGHDQEPFESASRCCLRADHVRRGGRRRSRRAWRRPRSPNLPAVGDRRTGCSGPERRRTARAAGDGCTPGKRAGDMESRTPPGPRTRPGSVAWRQPDRSARAARAERDRFSARQCGAGSRHEHRAAAQRRRAAAGARRRVEPAPGQPRSGERSGRRSTRPDRPDLQHRGSGFCWSRSPGAGSQARRGAARFGCYHGAGLSAPTISRHRAGPRTVSRGRADILRSALIG
jgi:hypothetical protein